MNTPAGPPVRPPQLSPDGRWVWDGKQWQPVAVQAPVAPPQISPDGRWVWSGKEWLPVARHEGVFSAWSVVTTEEEPAQQVETAIERQEIPVITPDGHVVEEEEEMAAPVYVAPAVASSTPLWQRRIPTGINKYAYIAGGVCLLLLAAVWLNSLGTIQFPWTPVQNLTIRPSPTPELTARSESAEASRYLMGFVYPALGGVTKAGNLQGLVCAGALTFSCRDDITATEAEVENLISVIDKHQPPDCIASNVASLRADLVAMDNGDKQGLRAYADNNPSELAQGIATFRNGASDFGTDWTAANNAMNAVCSPDITGP